MAHEQPHPSTPTEWHERILAKEAGFRVWLEDGRGSTGTLRRLDWVLSERDKVCHQVRGDFQEYQQWLSTFWEHYWDISPEQQRRELDLRNRTIQVQNAKDYLDG